MSNYYEETCLFSGRVSGNFTLTDDPTKYDTLRILFCSKDVGTGAATVNGFLQNFSPMYTCDISKEHNQGYVVLNNPFFVSRISNNGFSAIYDSVGGWTGTNTTSWKTYNNTFGLRTSDSTIKGEPWTWIRGIYGINYGKPHGFKKEVIYSGTSSNYPSYTAYGSLNLFKDPMNYERVGICFNCNPHSNNIPLYTELQTDVIKSTSGYIMLQSFYSDSTAMTDNLSNMTPWSGCTGTTWTRYPGTWYKNTNVAKPGVGIPWIYTIFGIGEK